VQSTNKLTLHAYQSNCVTRAIDILILQNCVSVLIQSATGSGKTVIAAGLIRQLIEINPSAKFMVVVPSMTLVEQFYNTLVRDMGIPAAVLHNTLKADKYGRPFSTKLGNVIITMPETFSGVVAGNSDLKLPLFWTADYLFMDEAHKNTAASSQAAKNYFPNCKIVGLTATPRREQNKDGEHLWSWYADRMITAASIADLIAMGFIVKPVVTRRPKGSHVVNDWLEYTKDSANKRTILVTTEVQFAESYEKAFRAAGVRAQLIEGKQTMAERQRYFKQFEDGLIDVLCSVDSLCEGFDCKPAKFLIIDRNMVSIALMHQCAGRVTRADGEKTAGYIFDYGNNMELDNIETKQWTHFDYAPDVKFTKRKSAHSASDFKNKKLAYTCEACLHVYDAAKHNKCTAAGCDQAADLKCRTNSREVLEKICGLPVVDIASYKLMKKMVEGAMSRPDIKAVETDTLTLRQKELAKVEAFLFAGNKVFDASNPSYAIINRIFAEDLNLDDPIDFCPFTCAGAVDLLAA